MSDDELIERVARAVGQKIEGAAEDMDSVWYGQPLWKAYTEEARAILPFIHEARIEGGKLVQEACAKDAETWFPAGSAERYPSSGVVASIRALNVEDIVK